MSHKADASFFDTKKEWSKRKDHILTYYLEPYLAKIATLKKPILLVDAFAGPGKFNDGAPGSPILMCAKAQKAIGRGSQVKVMCIESDPELFKSLKKNLGGFYFADAYQGTFLDHVRTIESMVHSHSIFLYVDPFAIEGFEWVPLDKVLTHLDNSNSSIELLLNFNSSAFVRRGLAALQMRVPEFNEALEDEEDSDAIPAGRASHDRLNRVVGGDWWKDILTSVTDFATQNQKIIQGFRQKLKSRFVEVCSVPIKARDVSEIPKYHMVFGSRSSDALELMNEAMIKVQNAGLVSGDLFAKVDLAELILERADDPIPRGELIVEVIREAFCRFPRKDIRGAIETLLREGSLKSETEKVRINDKVKVWRQG